ncbi:MAG: hypothetical protein HUJ31_13475 [Pseudomonadales bacterium]|nr:hypothetical protein [Pseudomonadales bacterium]
MDTTRWILVLALFGAAGATGQDVRPPETCDYGEPGPRAPAELGQFRFLIGDYRIHMHVWRDGEWSLPLADVTARWNGRYGLGGMVIIDEWFNPDPAQDEEGNHGINVRMYDPEENVWKMMWIATAGKTVQDLRAKIIDGVLTMWQVYPERPDFRAIFNVYDDRWERISFTHDDEGNWVRQYKLAATRIPCDNG